MNFTKRHGPLARCTALFIVMLATASAADYSKISPDLKPLLANPSNKINVIVQYNSTPCASSGLLGGVTCLTVNLLGGVLKTVLSLINAVAGILQPSDILSLSGRSDVSYISIDRSL